MPAQDSKSIAKSISAVASSSVSLVKALSKTISATVTPSAQVLKGLAVVLNAQVSFLASISTVLNRLAFIISNLITAPPLVRDVFAQALVRISLAVDGVRSVVGQHLDRIITRVSLIRSLTFKQDTSKMDSFSPKAADETQYFTFNYANVLASGETISSAAVTISNPVGNPSNSGTLATSGSPIIDGANVSQLIGGGRAQDQYIIKCRIVTSSGQSFDVYGGLSIS